jgi:hypothetical protein
MHVSEAPCVPLLLLHPPACRSSGLYRVSVLNRNLDGDAATQSRINNFSMDVVLNGQVAFTYR